MTEKTELCGFQPTGRSEDVPKAPRFLSKRELELQEVKYIFSLRAERDKLQEQLNTAKKALTEIYLDVNETIIDPVFLFHQSQRIAGRALNELGENNEI